jgi:hypothetical protein
MGIVKTIATQLQIIGPGGHGLRRLVRDRRSSVALMFALLALPLIGIVGLAIDYAMVSQTYSAMSLAAHGAALEAARIAAAGELGGDASYVSEGTTAGTKWFAALAGKTSGNLSTATPTVTVTPGTTIVAQVTYSGTMASFFGKVFGVNNYSIAVEAEASITPAPYLDVTVLIDASPSMLIGATTSDMATLMQLLPCSASGAYYPDASGNYSSLPTSEQHYNVYQCNYGVTYDGSPNCPVSAQSPYTFSTFTPVSAASGSLTTGPSCQGYLPKQSPSNKYPMAGPPCAFACHSDTSVPAGTGNDYFAVARSTIGKSNQVTLRLDVIKAATNVLLAAMQSYDSIVHALSVNVFTFADSLKPVYPSDGSYGDAWDTAIADVGAAPTLPHTADTGIQPPGGPDGSDTNFPGAMTTLTSSYLTASGTGTSAASPRKVLFLMTDGMENYSGTISAFDPSYCTTLKNKGYTIYVIYTTYYPLMNYFYLQSLMDIAEGTDYASTSYNLQSCASSTDDYIQATDGSGIQAALLTFLKSALVSPSLLTK